MYLKEARNKPKRITAIIILLRLGFIFNSLITSTYDAKRVLDKIGNLYEASFIKSERKKSSTYPLK